jgi:hypothetical protein
MKNKKTENVVKNSNHSHEVNYITKKKFPLKSMLGVSTWNEKKQSFTKDWESIFLTEGVVIKVKNLTESTFDLFDSLGKIGTYKFQKNTFHDYCEVF